MVEPPSTTRTAAATDADDVRQKTGFAIGGVPPIGHAEPMRIIVDEDLLQHGEVWAADAASLLDMSAGVVKGVK